MRVRVAVSETFPTLRHIIEALNFTEVPAAGAAAAAAR
jgi:hypothetical protein